MALKKPSMDPNPVHQLASQSTSKTRILLANSSEQNTKQCSSFPNQIACEYNECYWLWTDVHQFLCVDHEDCCVWEGHVADCQMCDNELVPFEPSIFETGTYNIKVRPKGMRAEEFLDDYEAKCGGRDFNTGNYIWQLGARLLLHPRARGHFSRHVTNPKLVYLGTSNIIQETDDPFGGKGVLVSSMAEKLERYNTSVIVMGMGAQSDFTKAPHDFKFYAYQHELFKKLAVHGPETFSVRGHYTEQILHYQGHRHVRALGCQSLFINSGPRLGFHLQAKYHALSTNKKPRILINLPGHKFQPRTYALLLSIFFQYPGSKIVLQTFMERSKIEWAMKQSIFKDKYIPPDAIVQFYDAYDWKDFMGQYDLVIGCRIHGNMIAIAAETPVFILAIDTRVWELADIMGIPHAKFNVEQGQIMTTNGKYKTLSAKKLVDFAIQQGHRFSGSAFEENRGRLACGYQAMFNTAGIPLNPEVSNICKAHS